MISQILCILKMEPTEFADGLDIRFGRKEGSHSNSDFWPGQLGRLNFHFLRWRKLQKEQVHKLRAKPHWGHVQFETFNFRHPRETLKQSIEYTSLEIKKRSRLEIEIGESSVLYMVFKSMGLNKISKVKKEK